MKGQDYKPSGMEKLVAQWPGFAGLGCVALGFIYIWYAKTFPPHIIYTRPLAGIFGLGVVLIMYWAFSSDSGNSNY